MYYYDVCAVDPRRVLLSTVIFFIFFVLTWNYNIPLYRIYTSRQSILSLNLYTSHTYSTSKIPPKDVVRLAYNNAVGVGLLPAIDNIIPLIYARWTYHLYLPIRWCTFVPLLPYILIKGFFLRKSSPFPSIRGSAYAIVFFHF